MFFPTVDFATSFREESVNCQLASNMEQKQRCVRNLGEYFIPGSGDSSLNLDGADKNPDFQQADETIDVP